MNASCWTKPRCQTAQDSGREIGNRRHLIQYVFLNQSSSMLFKFEEFFRTAPDGTDSKSEERRSQGRPQIRWNSRWEVKAVWPSFYLLYRHMLWYMKWAEQIQTRGTLTHMFYPWWNLCRLERISQQPSMGYQHTQHAASCVMQEVKKWSLFLLWPHFRVFLCVRAGQGSVLYGNDTTHGYCMTEIHNEANRKRQPSNTLCLRYFSWEESLRQSFRLSAIKCQ